MVGVLVCEVIARGVAGQCTSLSGMRLLAASSQAIVTTAASQLPPPNRHLRTAAPHLYVYLQLQQHRSIHPGLPAPLRLSVSSTFLLCTPPYFLPKQHSERSRLPKLAVSPPSRPPPSPTSTPSPAAAPGTRPPAPAQSRQASSAEEHGKARAGQCFMAGQCYMAGQCRMAGQCFMAGQCYMAGQ
eukprot:360641-Chlamydomonas_euryale.AAC.2